MQYMHRIFVENSKKCKGKHNTNQKHKKDKEHRKSWKWKKTRELITQELVFYYPFD